jgi:uncharacterized repeat protein (TIGR03987 family)
MSGLLISAIISMILALTFYSLGVWGEKIRGRLELRHLLFFWTGFVFDTAGTMAMGEIAGDWSFNIHSVTGAVALVLMAVHALWATFVQFKGSPEARKGFHRYSLTVWGIWLVPFIGGMIMAMAG